MLKRRVLEFWEGFFLKERARGQEIRGQALIAGAGFGLIYLLYRLTHLYSGAPTLITAFLIAILGDVLPALFFTLLLILLVDYYCLAPIGSVLNTRGSFEHFLMVASSAAVVNLLVCSLRFAFRNAALSKQAAERARQEAERSANAMEQTLALVSHDVRNPLMAVRTTAQLILRVADRPQLHQQLAIRIINDLDRADGMIQALLDVARIRAGQLVTLDFVYSDLRSIVARVVEDLSAIYGNRFEFACTEAILGNWSPEGIRRAVENLANNALKYGAQDLPVGIAVSRMGARALISVHNQGAEIGPEEQGKLFQAYQRASTARDRKGWGLGLTLVKGIAHAHGGIVRVESAEGQGTTFILELPIREAAVARTSPAA